MNINVSKGKHTEKYWSRHIIDYSNITELETMTGGAYCQPGQDVLLVMVLRADSLCLDLCLHLFIISARLSRSVLLSPNRMAVFSSIHRRHVLASLLQVGAGFKISHFNSYHQSQKNLSYIYVSLFRCHFAILYLSWKHWTLTRTPEELSY